MSKPAVAIAALFLMLGLLGAIRSIDFGNDEDGSDQIEQTRSFLPEITGPIPSARRFEHMGEFVSGLEDKGLRCSELQSMGVKGHPTLLSFKICDVGTPANRLDLYLYKSPRARDRWFESRIQSGLPWVYGPNWIVVIAGEPATAPERLDLVRRAIGGRVGPT